MAMLAEPRRKQKWSVDPRNSTWSKDESKFGQKMLEKMGWSKGKGLGAQEQGSTEHIRVQMKNNTLGLGASNNHEDNWIAHQDDYNQLLAELNSHHGTGSAASSDNENKTTFSLEEKSKSSKKRVHYMKFAKGKDLSCRSDTDLACIFGKREKVKKSPQEETNSEPEENENKSPSPTSELEPGNTVTSSLSVNEYFAKRMAELKKSYAKHTESVEQGAEDNSAENNQEQTKKKKSKKKKHRNDDDEERDVENNLQDENSEDASECRKRRKKSKSKRDNKELTAENSEDHEEEEEQDETPRKKKKNKRKEESYDGKQVEDVTSTPNEDVDTEQPKKKKKKRKQERTEYDERQMEEIASTPDEDVDTEQPKKKKKKKRKQEH